VTIEEIIAHQEEGGRFTVGGWSSGIAFYYASPQEVDDEDTVWTGQRVRTGFVIMVMVGDDYKHVTDPEDVQPIGEDDYCHVCGQIGCTHDGRDRE
jgi:hypothetical protein